MGKFTSLVNTEAGKYLVWLNVTIFLFVVAFSLYVFAEKQIRVTNEKRLRSYRLVNELRQSSDDLTRMARSYVVTKDPRFKHYYLEILNIRDGKNPRPVNYNHVYWDFVLSKPNLPQQYGETIALLDLMRKEGFTGDEFAKLHEAKSASDDLTQTEHRAMQIIENSPSPEEQLTAVSLLYDSHYFNAKARIMQPINTFNRMISTRTLNEVHIAEQYAVKLRVLVILLGIFIALLMSKLLKIINQEKKQKSENETKYRLLHEKNNALLRNASDGIYILNLQGNVIEANDTLCSMLGYSREQMLSLNVKQWDEQFEASDQNKILTEQHGANSRIQFETLHKRRDGSLFPAEVSGIPLILEDNPVMFYSSRDITERKKIESIIKANEEKLRLIINSVKDYSITMMDTDGIIISWNEGAKHIKGYETEEIIGRHFSCFYTQQDIDQRKPEQLLDLATKQGRAEDEGWRVRKDGSLFMANVIITAIQDDEGNLRGFTKVTRDISALKQTEFRLKKLILELKRSNQELDNFTYVASHDLKSPLRGINQLATWITEDLGEELNDDTKTHLRLMRSRIKRMENLLDDLLTYYRVGRSKEDLVIVDTYEMVKDILELCSHDKDIQIKVDHDLPELLTYKAPLELVFRNLISNAIKHLDKSSGVIKISASHNDGFVEFNVEDNGPGIPLEHQKRVFNMFQTLKPRDQVEGSGIGLSIVKKSVESVGGTVELVSDGQNGCLFRFTWPVKILNEMNAL